MINIKFEPPLTIKWGFKFNIKPVKKIRYSPGKATALSLYLLRMCPFRATRLVPFPKQILYKAIHPD